MSKYPAISEQIRLDNDCILGIDQYGGKDRTCLCFARLDGDKVNIEDIKYIEKQRDIDEYINTNLKEIYGVFGLSLDRLGGEN